MAVIVLELNNGIVECISNPTDIEVVLHDFDIQDTDNPNFEYGKRDGDDYCIVHFPPER